MHEAGSESHALAAPRGREVVRLESLSFLGAEGAAHIAVNQIVLDDAQARRDVVVGDTGLIETLGLHVWEKPQYVAYELFVIGY
jgi:hypothetical protein